MGLSVWMLGLPVSKLTSDKFEWQVAAVGLLLGVMGLGNAFMTIKTFFRRSAMRD
jgi:hypothetical protein